MRANRVVFIRSHDISADGRIQKYISILNTAGVPNRAVYWSRGGIAPKHGCDLVFRVNAKVGAGLRNCFKILLFNLWVLYKLCRERSTYDCIHAVDLDTIMPARLASVLFNKRLIYDVYDMYSASRNIHGWPGRMLDSLERRWASLADYCILPAKIRALQLQLEAGERVKILENVPANMAVTNFDIQTDSSNDQLTFSYVGIFERKHRGIEHLLQFFLSNPNYKLLIAGYGEISSEVESAAKRCENIVYYGAVTHSAAMTLMSSSDAIIGLYYQSVTNHAYASPNKYYEHLMLGRPLFTSAATPPGRLVDEFRTGVTVVDSYEALSGALRAATRGELSVMAANARARWDAHYKNYFEEYVVPTYLSMVAVRPGSGSDRNVSVKKPDDPSRSTARWSPA